jgi:hypothetical protein
MTPPQAPPPQIGLQVTGTEANNQAGTNTQNLIQTLQNLDNIRLWSEAYSAEELEALPGWPTPGTGATYKSAMGEVSSMVAALEATQFLKKLGGLGVG